MTTMWGYPIKLTIETGNCVLDVTDAVSYDAISTEATIDTEKILDALADDERPSNARKLLRELARELERNGL